MSMTVPNNAPAPPRVSDYQNPYPGRNYFTDGYTKGTLPGYFIQSESDIVPKYIPMDGSISFFPYRDLSKITIKQWDANGLNTLTYVLDMSNQSAQAQNNNVQNQNQSNQSQMLPETPTVPDPILETLQNLNNGLAATFQQFGTTLQGLQQEVSKLNATVSSVNGDLGGRG